MISSIRARHSESRRRKLRKRLQRHITLESLEHRHLLAADFHNARLPLDVTNDENVSPIDALIVINDINTLGARPLPPPSEAVTEFIDTNADEFVSAIDALLIINVLNTDTQPPVIDAQLANDTGRDGNNADGITRDPSIGGTVQDAAGVRTLFATVNDSSAVEVAIQTDGSFNFTPNLALDGSTDGPIEIRFQAIDALNQSASQTLNFTLDTIVDGINLDLAADSDTGQLGDRLTRFTTVDLVGQTEALSQVSINGNTTAEADASGNFNLSGVSLNSGINVVTVNVSDGRNELLFVTKNVSRMVQAEGMPNFMDRDRDQVESATA